ncbi:hypothetical protein ACFV2I_20255 [Streptomyces microflavus]|uniref:hypothetical protein n=1 Tax=Streptomyces microflavus TaxID=1919 RepID=UPI00367AB226
MAALSSEDAAALAREEFPDGTYGASRIVRSPGQPDPAAADHVQELTEALEGWRVGDRAELAARALQAP